MSFKGKVVIVTGGSSGIGASAAILFAKQSADVAIVGRNQTKLSSVAQTCEKFGKKPLIIIAELSNEEDVKTIVEKTVKHFGKLDVLVNNAGIGGIDSILSDKIMEVYDKVMSTNLRCIVQLTSLAAPELIKTKGNIVNVSSILSQIPHDQIAYTTSKAGLDHFSRSVALELAKFGVRVNVVSPGPVRTDIIMNAGLNKQVSDKAYEAMGEKTPLKGVSESEEIGNLIVFLASDKAKSMTGSSYTIDRGCMLLGSQVFK